MGIATLQIDIDSFQHIHAAYLKEGRDGSKLPSLYETAVVRFLNLLRSFKIQATFFLVGEDLLHSTNRDIIKEILKEGHEIANHTYTHPTAPTFAYSESQEREICDTHNIVEKYFSVAMTGFKAPAYSVQGTSHLDILEKLGYRYDSSLCPVSCVPLVKGVQHFLTGQKREKGHWGDFRNCLAPLTPFHPSKSLLWRKGTRAILELPVSTIPLLRLPFHASVAYTFGAPIFSAGFYLSRLLLPEYLNFQFHAFELVAPSEIPLTVAGKRPGAQMPLKNKLALISKILENISGSYSIFKSNDLVNQAGLDGSR